MQLMQFFAARADTGAVLPFARVFVFNANTTTKAALYDANGAALPNPVATSAIGLASFAAADGTYDIQVQSADGGYTAPLMRQQLLDLPGIAAALTAAFGSNRYASAAAGLADTGLANGKYFSVIPSATSNALEDVYLKVSGSTATLQGTVPSFAGVNALIEVQRALLAKMDNRTARIRPTKTKPGIAIKVSSDFWAIRVYGQVGAGFSLERGDFMEFLLYNAGANIGGGICWAIAATRAFYKRQWWEASNFVSEQTTPAVNDTGLQYTTHEFALALFKTGQTPSPSVAPYIGPYHGGMNYVSLGSFINKDASGAVNYILDAYAPDNTILYFTTLEFSQQFNLIIPSGEVACRTTLSHLFNATDGLNVSCTHDFTHADVNCTPRIWNSYVSMYAARAANRFKAIGATALTLNNAPGTQTNIGKKSVSSFFHSNDTGVILEKSMRYGVPMRVNTFDDSTWAYQNNPGAETFIVESDEYTKQYDHPFSFVGTASADMTGKVITTSNAIKIYVGTAQ